MVVTKFVGQALCTWCNMATLITEYFSHDTKRGAAILVSRSSDYTVQLFENGEPYDTVQLKDKSLNYAEDVAENFCQYIGKFSK